VTEGPFFQAVDEAAQKKEKEKARQLRQSSWWVSLKGRGRCAYCQAQVPPAELTMDHQTPIARGGLSNKRNIVPCCKACNVEKGHLTLNEWRVQRHAQGNPLPLDEELWT
jgi:5-methylcytosine-specific restriction protein A